MKQLFSFLLCLLVFVSINSVSVAGDVTDKQSYEVVSQDLEQSSFDLLVFEVEKQPYCSHELQTIYANNDVKQSYFFVVDVGKGLKAYYNNDLLEIRRSNHNQLNALVYSARSRLTCKA